MVDSLAGYIFRELEFARADRACCGVHGVDVVGCRAPVAWTVMAVRIGSAVGGATDGEGEGVENAV